jgi:hypothetical protein
MPASVVRMTLTVGDTPARMSRTLKPYNIELTSAAESAGTARRLEQSWV